MDTSDRWYIESIPFVWSPLTSPSNGNAIPDRLPFVLTVDEETGLLAQESSRVVGEALDTAYVKGSFLSGLMDESGIGRNYADDFLAYILRSVDCPDLSGMRILEIGCGNGYLLKRLSELGAEVIGIEPGEHGQSVSSGWGVQIIQGYYPSDEVVGAFDLIISFAVLEHIEAPVAFLKQIKASLKDGGKVIIGVPDESEYINNGDVSTLFHEHWSYFDSQTLSCSVRLAGYRDLTIERSDFGGSLYCTMQSVDENLSLGATAWQMLLAERENTFGIVNAMVLSSVTIATESMRRVKLSGYTYPVER